MGKVLRVFIVLLFLLSIAALVLGVQLFGQREQLKGRTQRLERGLVAVSEKLTAPRDPHIAALPSRVDVDVLRQYDRMEEPLRLVETMVETRADELFTSRTDLRQVRDELTEVRQELVSARDDLQRAQERVAQLQRDVERKDGEIATLNGTVREREVTIQQHEGTIEQQNAELAGLREEKDELQHLVDRLERLIPQDDIGEVRGIPAGLAGRVILVEPEWNFVILDIGADAGLLPNAELLVHREDAYVGRIRVITVRDHIAVADIQRDTKMTNLLEGDNVFFPGG